MPVLDGVLQYVELVGEGQMRGNVRLIFTANQSNNWYKERMEHFLKLRMAIYIEGIPSVAVFPLVVPIRKLFGNRGFEFEFESSSTANDNLHSEFKSVTINKPKDYNPSDDKRVVVITFSTLLGGMNFELLRHKQGERPP